MALSRWSLLGLLLVGVIAPLSAQTGGFWPQFRGPNRSNTSSETGLLKEWPADGPPLLWKITNLGNGYAPVSVAEGRVYTVAYREGTEYAVALDRGTGKELWATLLGPSRAEGVMQFLMQRQPVVDGDRLYAFAGSGELFCLDVDAGAVLWKKNYRQEFKAVFGGFGPTDNPLVDGDRLICTPGGKDATMVALNKRTGEVIWKAVVPQGDHAAYSPIVVAEVGGTRMYVKLMGRGLVGIAAKDGKYLWRYDRASNATANCPPPVVQGEYIFVASGYNSGSALLKLTAEDDSIMVEELYFTKDFQNLNGGMVLVGDHIYGGCRGGFASWLGCLEFKTGNILWKQKGDYTAVLLAEGKLYCHHGNGDMSLVEPSHKEFKEISRFKQPDRTSLNPWAYPVLAGGKLYLRDQGVLLCYDLRAERPVPLEPPAEKPAPTDKPSPDKPAPKEPPSEKPVGTERLPDAIYVPSPPDVVDRMVELAGIKKSDLIMDLGCGDGRILVAAAKAHGCQAVGVDIDPDCVKAARENVRKNKVEDLVTIEAKDIFEVDLSKVDVVMLYLLPELNVKLLPQLQKLKPGARIVSHAFAVKGTKPDKVVNFRSTEDGLERPLYLWSTPLKKEE